MHAQSQLYASHLQQYAIHVNVNGNVSKAAIANKHLAINGLYIATCIGLTICSDSDVLSPLLFKMTATVTATFQSDSDCHHHFFGINIW
jgi:hypothetical protein